jgi:hypothetical protein
MLNSPDADYYLSKRDKFRGGDPIGELRFPGYGTASFFNQLCEGIEHACSRSFALEEALEQFIEGRAIRTPWESVNENIGNGLQIALGKVG